MENSRDPFSGKISLDFATIVAIGIVHAHNQLFAVEQPLGCRILVCSFWCDNSQEGIMIEFPFRRKNIEDQKIHTNEKYAQEALPRVILQNSQWIRSDQRTKIRFRSRHPMTLRIHHF
jgi:hypothetical protein